MENIVDNENVKTNQEINNDEKIYHFLIYMYTFPNGKKYIGKSSKPLSQRQGHDWNKYKTCTLLWRAIQKYGTDNIETTILEEGDMTNAQAGELERKYIAEYKTNANRYRDPQYGYNLTDGGEGLRGWHPDGKRYEQMMQQLVKAKEVRLSQPVSESTRQKMREAKLGKKHGPLSEETKRKIGEANSLENISDETRRRKSEAHKKKVLLINTDDNSEQIVDSCGEVARMFGVWQSAVSKWLQLGKIPNQPYLIKYYRPTTNQLYFFKYYTPTTTKRERADDSSSVM